MEILSSLYKEELGFTSFYDKVLNQVHSGRPGFIESERFLKGIGYDSNIRRKSIIEAQPGDVRIDVPVWFGDLNLPNRIIAFGLEPRDAHKLFNIDKVGNRVFACTFGADRWSLKSKIGNKNRQNRYKSVLDCIYQREDSFLLCSDAVKKFYMGSSVNNKKENEAQAREKFFEYVQQESQLIIQEIAIVQPTQIFAFGKDCYDWLIGNMSIEYPIVYVKHPSRYVGEAKKTVRTWVTNNLGS